MIHAPIERCFLLSLSVDLHRDSTHGTGEKAVEGITSGIMKLNDTVTWEAKHLGVRQRLTTKVSMYNYPNYFVSEMVQGIFKKIYHQHIFHSEGDTTIMTDLFAFAAPLGVFGRIAEKLFLEKYMRGFLIQRNLFIKQTAESESWHAFIK